MFDKSGVFFVPKGKTTVRVLVIGGGGGGGCGHFGGGGSGYVNSGVLEVTDGDQHAVTVGSGGLGAAEVASSSLDLIGNTDGGESSFSNLLLSGGGKTPRSYAVGGNGGSGGGVGGYNCAPEAHNGGSNGASADDCISTTQTDIWGKTKGGTGQGNFRIHFAIFKQNSFTSGAGGIRSSGKLSGAYYWRFGSGGGGVLMNGEGPKGQGGPSTFRGYGGIGYGAGGGSGGFDDTTTWTRLVGGNGAGGLVYIEWD